MAGMTVSGAVSGLDTASIINSLIAVEANQQTLLRNKQSAQQKTVDAYASLMTRLNAVSTAATSLAKTSDWNGLAVTSSSSSVAATATGTFPGSLTFDVTSVAKAHTLISDSAVAGLSSTVASGGSLTLTRGAVTEQIDVGDGSLSSVMSAINNGGYGLRATAVQVSAGQYRLQVQATSTGAASTFSIDGLDGFAGVSELATGSDAKILVGAGTPSEFSVTSTTNTFADVVPGLSFTVSKLETGVTVSSTLDSTKVAEGVQKLVDAANDVLSSIAAQSTWNATTKTGGALNGEAAVRGLQQKILSLVTGAQAQGVHVTRDGKVTFDKDEFAKAFNDNPAAVAAQFGATSSFDAAAGVTGSVGLARAGTDTRVGTYDVQVAVTAAREQWRTDPPGGVIAGQTIVVQRGSTTVTYTAGAGDTIADVVAAVNTQLSTNGLGITAVDDGSGIVFTARAAGAAAGFTVTVDGVDADQVTAGRDVQGSINGVLAKGTGNTLTGASTAKGAAGLALTIDITDADLAASGGDIGAFTYTPGLAQSLVDLVKDATETGKGSLAVAQDGLKTVIKDMQAQIDAWDDRLSLKRQALSRQFTAMETALARLKSQSSFLASFATQAAANSSSSDS